MSKPNSDWSEWLGEKNGKLTVVRIIPAAEAAQMGIIKGRASSCGNKGCRGWAKNTTNRLLPSYQAQEHGTAVIIERLKPKYECNCPTDCPISSVCHICCWECDRTCKACANRPEKCGAKRRK